MVRQARRRARLESGIKITVETVETRALSKPASVCPESFRGEKRGVNKRQYRALPMTLRVICGLLLLLTKYGLFAAERWEKALSRMPLDAGITELNRTNCVEVMLRALQSNAVVKALIFMPGATDEFYMFKRAKARLTNSSPSLLDAVSALTNQTLIRANFREPFLLLHTEEDPLEPLITVESESAAEKLRKRKFVAHGIYNDRDWDFIQPILRDSTKADIRPWRYSRATWHFYRHSFAAWDLNGWEALEVVALAGKTRFAVRRKALVDFHQIEVEFRPDTRVLAVPTLDAFPR